MNFTRFSWILLATLACLGIASCSGASTPPAPNMAGGVYIRAGYEYFLWEEGLAVMVWHDAIKSSSCDSSGSTSGSTHVVQCQAVSEINQSFNWQIETNDGLTGEFKINNKPFNLADGNVFVVTTSDGITDILQLQRDLAGIVPESESIIEFGLSDPEIKQFIELTSSD